MLLATRSAGKRRELEPMLRSVGWEVVDLDGAGIAEDSAVEDALESALTFEENALAKARHFAAMSGLPTVADDSGIACDALGGAPGVHSKRWGAQPGLSGLALDAANNALLLARLAEAARGGVTTRAARYVCAAAYVEGAREIVVRGESTGRILEQEEGSGGFGYDPLFLSDDLGRSFGVVTPEEKARVSHRGRAFACLIEKLRAGS
ncbi:MAG: non-canonical purine NTP pyrophosphatase [Gemmatimonadetes bacterium]|nr:non-canonical purine NTP pyrophosphatase [Gemmatimonadota bacterium]